MQPFQHRHIYDVDEMQEEAMDVDDFSFVEDGVYQENDVDDAFEVSLGEIQSLNREDMDPEDVEELVISRLPEVVEENLEDVDEEDELDETLVDYCSTEDDSQQQSDSENDTNDDNS